VEKNEMAQQVKLGAFVLAGVLLFLVAVFFIGSENNIFSKTFTISAVFRNVEGLKQGDNVWLSGVKVGTVSDVKILAQGRVVVDLSLRDKQSQFIPRDAVASIGSDGLVGNKIVVLRPGVSKQQVGPSDTIRTMSPTDTQQLFDIARDVGENTRAVTADLRTLIRQVNAGEGVIGELFHEGRIARELRATITQLRVSGQNTAEATSKLNSLLTAVREGDGLASKLIYDSGYAMKLNASLENLRLVSERAEQIAGDLSAVTGKMTKEDNAAGVLLTDSSAADNVRNTLSNLESATDKLDENMEALRHNFLFRRYFRKQKKREQKEEEKREPASSKSY